MFGHLRTGYWSLLLFTAAAFIWAVSFWIAIGNADIPKLFGLGGVGQMLPAWILPPLIWFGYLAVVITFRQVDRPLRAIRTMTFRHRHWLYRGSLFTVIMFPLGRAFSAYKSTIPDIVPFYADPFLVAADRMLFGGDAWRLTHALIGPMGTIIIDKIYALWFIEMMILIGWMNFTRNQNLQIRSLMSYVIIWFILGNIVATTLSSVGPCFYDIFYGDRAFDPLMQILHGYDDHNPLWAVKSMQFLVRTQGTETFGAGISAMPSLHVSIAYLCFLVTLSASRWLWLKLLAGLFAVAILIGSVHLGWHYAVDGLFAIIVVTLIWIGTGRYVDWLERRTQQAPEPGAGLIAGGNTPSPAVS